MTETESTEYALKTVTQIMTLYSTMMHGQICNGTNLTQEEKIASLLYAADVMAKTHTKAIVAMCEEKNVSPTWMVSKEKVDEQAAVFCKRVVEGK
jgi:hypothetical protein